ncbi:hypothetical protein, partial [Escherichia coli]|uniref:hypothetical protein n=1 Tax=Escherichia coli TaxID=562 RepID=UPI001F499EB3
MVCVVGKIRDLILQLSKSSIYSTKPGEEINNDMLVSMLLNSGHGIFSDNDEQETKADSKESAQK